MDFDKYKHLNIFKFKKFSKRMLRIFHINCNIIITKYCCLQ